MCQTRFKISKEIKPEVTPPLLKNNYVSIIYGFGKPDRFRLGTYRSQASTVSERTLKVLFLHRNSAENVRRCHVADPVANLHRPSHGREIEGEDFRWSPLLSIVKS